MSRATATKSVEDNAQTQNDIIKKRDDLPRPVVSVRQIELMVKEDPPKPFPRAIHHRDGERRHRRMALSDSPQKHSKPENAASRQGGPDGSLVNLRPESDA